jgi:energy-coupling factor transport system ATP-binding protein
LKPCMELNGIQVYVPGQGEPVLHGINMAVGTGEWLVVTGKNGSGKSVLARLLAGLDGRYEGEIRRSSEGTKVQLIMQNPEAQLIGDTVWEDICFGLEARGIDAELIPQQAVEALKQAGLAGLEHRSVKQLSGGQKQQLALAGALAAGPSVLVADEATSMLDPSARLRFLELLKKLQRQGMTIIMVTQLLEEAACADRIVALRQGMIAYEGDVREFFYGSMSGGENSACEAAGLVPPYAVRAAKEMLRQGVPLEGAPLTPEELEETVKQLCQ